MFVAPYSEGTSYTNYAVVHANINKDFRVPQSDMNWLTSICDSEVI